MSLRIDLSADVAVVTGGGGRVGGSVAALLARAGARTAVLDASCTAAKTVAERITADGGSAIGVEVDVTDEAAVREALGAVREQLGPVSVLVNAPGPDVAAECGDDTGEQTRRVVELTLIGTINVMRAALGDLLTHDGRIVNTVSECVGTGGPAMGACAGAGVIAVTRSLAEELRGTGVRANVVGAGLLVAAEGSSFMQRFHSADVLARAHPLGRLGTAADIAGAVLFLASPLSGSITGKVLSVNGGYGML